MDQTAEARADRHKSYETRECEMLEIAFTGGM
jgi:hypothetical protein